MALALVPESPVADWFAQLDAQIEGTPSFFVGRPVVVDFGKLAGQEAEFPGLIQDLQARGIHIVGVEGLDPALSGGEGWPPLLTGGRPAGLIGVAEETPPEPPPHEPPSLLLDQPVRSGQAVVFEKGDVIVVGSVASGAEIVAGGSIHVYGTLRGRAVAGLLEHGQARIFCRKLEAELLAIDGLYRTADDMEPGLRGRAVQARLDGNAMIIVPLD